MEFIDKFLKSGRDSKSELKKLRNELEEINMEKEKRDKEMSLDLTLHLDKEYEIQINTQQLKEKLSEFSEISSIDILGKNNVFCKSKDAYFGFSDKLVKMYIKFLPEEWEKEEEILLFKVFMAFLKSLSNRKDYEKISWNGELDIIKRYKNIKENIINNFVDKRFLLGFNKATKKEGIEIMRVVFDVPDEKVSHGLSLTYMEENLSIMAIFGIDLEVIRSERDNITKASKEVLTAIRDSIEISDSCYSFFEEFLKQTKGGSIKKEN